MANSRAHIQFNNFILISVSFLLIEKVEMIAYICGFLLASLYFSPDFDLKATKRSFPLGYFFIPYSWFFKHRGLSHHIIIGPISRLVYLILLMTMIEMLFKQHYFNRVFKVLYSFQNGQLSYEFPLSMELSFLVGFMLADWGHILLDNISTFIKKLK